MKNDSKKKCLACLKKTYCRLQPSGLDGVGVFAIRDIPKGTNVFYGSPKPAWLWFSKKELACLDREVKKMIDDFLPTSSQRGIYIPVNGFNGIDISFFLNHSDKPNCKNPDRSNDFIAIKKIKKGEELTSNYTTYDPCFKTTKKFKNLAL